MRDPSAGRNCSFENKLEPGLVTGQRFYREAPQRSDTSAYAGFSSSRSTVSPMRCDSYQARPDRRCAVRTDGWHHTRHSRTDFLAGDLSQCLIGDGRRCVRAECRGTDIETLPIRRAEPARRMAVMRLSTMLGTSRSRQSPESWAGYSRNGPYSCGTGLCCLGGDGGMVDPGQLHRPSASPRRRTDRAEPER